MYKIPMPSIPPEQMVTVYYNDEFYAFMNELQFSFFRLELLKACIEDRKKDPTIKSTDLTPYSVEGHRDNNTSFSGALEKEYIDYSGNMTSYPYEFGHIRRNLWQMIKLEREFVDSKKKV